MARKKRRKRKVSVGTVLWMLLCTVTVITIAAGVWYVVYFGQVTEKDRDVPDSIAGIAVHTDYISADSVARPGRKYIISSSMKPITTAHMPMPGHITSIYMKIAGRNRKAGILPWMIRKSGTICQTMRSPITRVIPAGRKAATAMVSALNSASMPAVILTRPCRMPPS